MADEEGFEADPLIPHRPDAQQVALTTLHQSKGLEFDAVFIANAVEGVFPDLRRSRRMLRPELLSPERVSDGTAQHLFQIQEEMRLAYTAMTRARLRVIWTATNAGADQGEHRPSRFLVAASGAASISEIGPPVEDERPPVTVMEAEVAMRRAALDPSRPSPERLAATRVLASPPDDWWQPSAFAGVPAPGPDRPILGASLTLSPSQADSYSVCPRRYALERRLRLGDAGSPYSQFGTLVHSALERRREGGGGKRAGPCRSGRGVRGAGGRLVRGGQLRDARARCRLAPPRPGSGDQALYEVAEPGGSPCRPRDEGRAPPSTTPRGPG